MPACACCRERPIDPRWRPFCSERCRLIDLGRWLNGDYRIAGAPADPDSPDEATDAPAYDDATDDPDARQ